MIIIDYKEIQRACFKTSHEKILFQLLYEEYIGNLDSSQNPNWEKKRITPDEETIDMIMEDIHREPPVSRKELLRIFGIIYTFTDEQMENLLHTLEKGEREYAERDLIDQNALSPPPFEDAVLEMENFSSSEE